MNRIICTVCFALAVLGAKADGEPWGWAYNQGGNSVALSERSPTGGAVLTNGMLAAGYDRIRFASGTVKVSRIEVEERHCTFFGEGTTLEQEETAYRQHGGAISVMGGSVLVSNLVFRGFYVTKMGGALSLWGLTGDSAVVNCRFEACAAEDIDGDGGALWATAKPGSDVKLSVVGTTFENCEAEHGGAVSCFRTDPASQTALSLYVTNSTFSGNTAYGSGGAVFAEGDVTFDAGTLFDGNAADDGDGGAVCIDTALGGLSASCVACLPGVVFRNNRANVSGGYEAGYGVYGGAVALMKPDVSFSAEKTAFFGNGATYGGAICAYDNDTVRLSTCVFSNNVVSAEGLGGAIDIEYSALAMTNVTVRGSNSTALDVFDGQAELINCVIVNGDAEGADIGALKRDVATSVSAWRSAFGTLTDNGSDVSVTTNGCLVGCTTACYDGDSLSLRSGEPYNPVAAEGIVQTATDFAGVAYGSLDYGSSMGAFECASVIGISSEPFEGVYDGNGHTITVSSVVSAIPITWSYATNSLGPWEPETPAYTNVGVYWVWAKASADVFTNPMVTSNTVTITSAPFDFIVTGYQKQYDGQAHGVTIEVDAKYGAQTYYSTDGVEWSETQSDFEYTDVTNLTVYVKLETQNYGTKTGFAKVEIAPRDITFEGPKKSRAYNPNLPPLTFDKSEIAIGGQKYAENEEFAYDNFAKISEVGETPAVFECLDNPNTTPKTKLSNYNITILSNNLLTITVSADQLGVASLGNTWTYDGNEHGMGYEVYNRENLIDGDEIEVVLDGVKITYPGKATNTIKSVRILRKDEDVTASYLNLVVTTGVLQVVNADFKSVVATPVNRKYDGKPHSIEVKPNEPLLAPDAVVAYSWDGVTYGAENPAYSNVVSTTVWYKVSAPYFNDFYGSASVVITKRSLEFASEDSSQVECDKELWTDISKIKETSNSDGIVAGEKDGITFKATGHAKTVAESGADATFDVVFDEVRALSGNYEVKTIPGKLYISEKGTVTVYAPSHEFSFDDYGEDNVWHETPKVDGLAEGEYIDRIAWDAASKIRKPSDGEVSNVITSAVVKRRSDGETLSSYKLTYVPGVLTMAKGSLDGLVTATGIDKVYDNVTTNITVSVLKEKLVDPKAAISYEYRTTEGSDWSPANPDFRNVTDLPVSYRVSVEDYEPYIGSVQATISHRTVQFVSASATKKYDGAPLTTNLVTVAEGDGLYGIAAGEYLCYNCTGSITDVGESKNFFDYWLTNAVGTAKADLAANYHFVPEWGVLKVTSADLQFDLKGFSGPYDGLGHGPALDDSGLPSGYACEYSADKGLTWQDDVPLYTNVTERTILVRISADNYESVMVSAGIDIYPRELLLVAPDLKRTYNGEELSFTGKDIQAGGLQYATGECFRYFDFAAITTVGRVASTFTYDDSEDGKTLVSNYKVTIAPDRWLEVLPDAGKIVVRSLSYFGAYDGKSHDGRTPENPDGFEIIDNGNLMPGDRVEAVLVGKLVTYPSDGIVSNTFASVKILRGDDDVTESYTNIVEVIGTLEVVPADFADSDIEAVGVERTYDGTVTNVSVSVKNELAKDTSKILYSTNGVDFAEENPPFKNVCDVTVTYIVTNANFNPYTNATTATISKRTVCFKSKSDWKFYDGTPLVATNIIEVKEGYDGFVSGEGVESFVNRASITQKGSCDASFDVKLADNTLALNYTIKKNFGTLSVYWSEGLIIVAGSKEFAYDGESHECHTCDYRNLDAGDALKTDDFVYVGSISHPDQSPVENWIRRASVKVVNDKGEDVTAKYGEFALISGELTMEKLSLDGLVTAEDAVKVYDGEATNVTVSVNTAKLPAVVRPTVTIRYSGLPNAGFGAVNPTRTKAGKQDVYYYVSADGCDDSQVGKATIDIATRTICLASSSATRPYDGKPLVTNEVVCAKGEGLYDLAKGDFLEYACYGSQTIVGDCENRFTFAITNVAKDVSLKDNYFVTFDYGKLVVTPAEQKKDDPHDPPEGALTPYDYIGMYDGLPHSITPFTVTNPAVAKIFYSTNGRDWVETKFFKTDVCALEKIWFKSVASNYVDIVTNGFVTITNRPVTVKSASGSYVYDGKAHGTNDFSVTGGGFVEREGITAENWASIATVAESGKSNSFDEVWKPDTKASNYLFTKEYGTLTMMPASMDPPDKPDEEPPYEPGKPGPQVPPSPQGPQGQVIQLSYYDRSVVYDGNGYTIDTNTLFLAAQEKTGNAVTNVQFSTDGCQWQKEPFVYTNVVATSFWYRVGAENYSNYYHAAGVTITPRSLDVSVGDLAIREWEPVPTSQMIAATLTYESLPTGDGFKISSDQFFCKHDNTPVGTHADVITTNQLLVITNSVGRDVTFDYAIHFKPGALVIAPATPMLTGTPRYKYHQAQNAFYCGFEVACTNGDHTIISNLCFIFENRSDCYLRDLKSTNRLSDVTGGRFEWKGTVFGKVRMTELEEALRKAGGLCKTKTWGVTSNTWASSRFVVPTTERKAVLAVSTGLAKLAKGDISVLEDKLGYLVWQQDGKGALFSCPLTKRASEVVSAFGATAKPLSLANVNRSLAFGLPAVTEDSNPTLCIDSFIVGDGSVSGRVITSAGSDKGTPGANAAVTVMGAENLQGPFVKINGAKCNTDGSFSVATPAGMRFFKVRLEVVTVID